jgi:hypothetical protein
MTADGVIPELEERQAYDELRDTASLDCGLLYRSYTERATLTITMLPDGSARLTVHGLPTIGLFPSQVKQLISALTPGT